MKAGSHGHQAAVPEDAGAELGAGEGEEDAPEEPLPDDELLLELEEEEPLSPPPSFLAAAL